MSLPGPAVPETVRGSGDIVCYCFNKSREELMACHRRLGSLAAVQTESRAGTNCGGCRLLLEELFGEAPGEILSKRGTPSSNPRFCVKPGVRLLKGFIAADHELDTVVYASNGAPPQFGAQDMSTPVEYALLDGTGRRILHRKLEWKTHETFRFDTREESLPRPLHGMFLFLIGRENFGAARFNTVWTNGAAYASTHEIHSSGRPAVMMPLLAEGGFLEGPNSVHIAIQNPHHEPLQVFVVLYDDAHRVLGEIPVPMGPQATRWINANREFLRPALERSGGGPVSFRVESRPMSTDRAPTSYFFFRNRATGIWTANHL